MPSIKPSVGDKNSVSLDDICFLMSATIVEDEIGQQIETLLPEMVYCSVVSIGHKEFGIAAQANLKAERTILINHDEYDGQTTIEYNRKKYNVYRTFVRTDGHIELFCEVKVGGN